MKKKKRQISIKKIVNDSQSAKNNKIKADKKNISVNNKTPETSTAKRKTRKYIPRNEFRKNQSPSARGHYDYVFGETNTHYKSLGLTTSPHDDDKYTYYKLSKNPNPSPKNDKDSFLRLNVRSTNKKYMNTEPEKGWKFAKEDMPVVRHTIKKYKKSTNRHPKNWHIKKREKNKKK